MDVKATLVTKTSKNGNEYKCIELQLTPTYKKVVFWVFRSYHNGRMLTTEIPEGE